MSLSVKAWIRVGEELRKLLESPETSPFLESWNAAKSSAYRQNAWFRPSQTETALKGIVNLLDPAKLERWASRYNPAGPVNFRKVGVIMAGNIPMAGFHDMLCVNLSGHQLIAKLSSDDNVLLPFISEILKTHDAEAASRISFAGNIKDAEAVIATGSNNTSRYFEYYFGRKPHIFRKNRNSVSILTGEENEYDLILLGKDIFTYYGLGCRNVSKLYVPEGYVFDPFFEAMQEYAEVMEHNKYMNNYDYNRSVYLLNSLPFLTNNFLIIMNNPALSTPVSVVNYETYANTEALQQELTARAGEIQCITGKTGPVLLGRAQTPDIDDYADGVDTMAFLTSL